SRTAPRTTRPSSTSAAYPGKGRARPHRARRRAPRRWRRPGRAAAAPRPPPSAPPRPPPRPPPPPHQPRRDGPRGEETPELIQADGERAGPAGRGDIGQRVA